MPEEPSGNMGMLLTFLPMALGSSMMILLFVTPGEGGPTTWLRRRPDDGDHDVDDGRPDGQDDQHAQAAHERRAPRLPAIPEPDPQEGQAADGSAAQVARLDPSRTDRALVGRYERAAVGTASWAPRLRRYQDRDRAAALRGQDQPNADQAGRGS